VSGLLTGPVLVVGAGLLGTSVGLALRARGIEVFLADLNEENLRTASGLGAGSSALADSSLVQLVVVAVPPDHLGSAIASALTDSSAVVTDVGSVKGAPLAEVGALVPEDALARYVGGHPMAGSERSGPLAASSVLFDGRPWAVAPHATSSPEAVALVTALVEACGATPFRFSPEEHDQAVARTSHLPHVVAALVAGSLSGAPAEHLVLSGQGVRDVTRIAAGDPHLWQQILTANSAALVGLLREVRADLDGLLDALEDGSRRDLGEILGRGVAGTAAIPGKHGGPAAAETGVFVAVPDHPGELARLFNDVGDIGVNVEDVRIDHDPGRPVGLVELTVAADRAEHLLHALAGRGWSAHR
jgi:prephenate dehydrogenase